MKQNEAFSRLIKNSLEFIWGNKYIEFSRVATEIYWWKSIWISKEGIKVVLDQIISLLQLWLIVINIQMQNLGKNL